MTSDANQVKAIFLAAVEQPPEQWSAYLDGACAAAPALRRQVEALLRAHAGADRLFDQSAPGSMTHTPAVGDSPGAMMGPYQLVAQLGAGGMGIVFLAEQHEPVHRQVALKLIKPGMDSRHVIARFEAERQALAIMDHAHIAKVLDVGESGSGRPYFVMELCRGEPITDHCDRDGLGTRQRLELFVTVCKAVQHAHQKGIIHRDLKPSNVLVVLRDGVPVVKVIDFGIAKALGQALTENTLLTGAAQMLGTPLYMSPEQAEMSGDIDTRSDIYSLGVLLYEMLTGMTPFDRQRLHDASFDEVRRIIRQEEPPRPSTRLSTLGQAANTVSTQRQSDPRRLSRLLRGELDWIVMRALEKDRNRRYETAGALAADVERYLRDEPVLARPASAWYRLRMLARRRRAALTMTVVVAAALIGATAAIGGSIGWALNDEAARAAAQQHEQAVRDAALDEQVDRDVAEASAIIDGVDWPSAAPALARAEKLVRAAGRAELPPRLRAMQRDLAMVQRLEQIPEQPDDAILHAGYETREAHQAANAAYARAFQDYGIDPLVAPATEANRRLGASNIRLALASGLDAWAYQRVNDRDNHTGWQGLLQLAKRADPDPWRNRLRDVLLSVDPQQPLPADTAARLTALADLADVRTLPAGTLLLLWRALEAAGAAEASLPLLRRAQLQYPGDFRLNIALAHAYMHHRKDAHADDAARFYTAALAARPDSRYVRFHLAEALCAKGAFPAAVDEANALLQLRPGDPSAIGLRAKVALAMNDPRQTIVDCTRLLAHKPGLIAALALRAEAHERLRQWNEALTDYDAAIRVAARKHVYLYPMRARVRAARGEWQAVLADYKEATAIAPLTVEYWHDRAHAEAVLGKWGDAAWNMGNAVARKPADTGWRVELIAYLLQDGDPANAVENCRRMLKQFGEYKDPTVAQRVALVFLLSPKTGAPPAAAVTRAALAFKAFPDFPWFALTQGAALYRTGAYDQAVALLEALDKKGLPPRGSSGAEGGRIFGWLLLAMAHHQLGHARDASQGLGRAVAVMDRETAAPTIGLLRQEASVWAMCLLLRGEAEALLKMRS